MIANIIVKPQINLTLWKVEADILIDALKVYEPPSKAVKEVIDGTIKELNKINAIEV